MPKIIFTSRYFKSGAQVVGLLKYVATREGVEIPKTFDLTRPATVNQQRLIAEIISRAPDAKDSYEYEDYAAAQTISNASDFIAAAFESHPELWNGVRQYVNYIAKRPGAVRSEDGHGLWNSKDEPIDLNAVADEVANHGGKIWTHVVSLRRADAERCGYTSATAWRELVRSKMSDVANAMKIQQDNLKWYAAYHDKESNPHVHIMVYSSNPREGFLTEPGIEKMRSAFATAIYKNELMHIYEQKDVARAHVNEYADERLTQLMSAVSDGQSDPLLSEMLGTLSRHLHVTKGKKQYGYLKPPLKRLVDEIVERLSYDPRIAEMYRHWCDLAAEQKRFYTGDFPESLPLVHEPTFRTVKNLVVKVAAQRFAVSDIEPEAMGTADELPPLSEGTTSLPPYNDWHGDAEPLPDLGIAALSLLRSVAQLISDDYTQKRRDIEQSVDSKLMQKIRRKKEELGQRME